MNSLAFCSIIANLYCSSSKSLYPALGFSQERGSLARPGEGQSLKIVVNGGNHSSHHVADQNMNEQPIEQVPQNISRRHPSTDKIEVRLLA